MTTQKKEGTSPSYENNDNNFSKCYLLVDLVDFATIYLCIP